MFSFSRAKLFAFGFTTATLAGASTTFFAFAAPEDKVLGSHLTYRHQKFPVIATREISHDTKVITFGLGEGQIFHLDCPQTLQVSCFDYSLGRRISRHYTPISPNGTKGHFDVMIKKYPGGYMSTKIHDLKVGDTADWSMVPPAFMYKPGMYDNLYMIAGGVGITPMLQMIRTVLSNPKDKTKMKLLFCNKTEQDILLREELEKIAAENPDRFNVTYAIDRYVEGWKGEVGYVTAGMIMRTLKKGGPQDGDKIMICGPDKMMKRVAGVPEGIMMFWSGKNKTQPTFQGVNNLGPVMGILGDLGWDSDNTWRF